ncbi:unnamed protein product [Tilletia controversa]|nr:unnamed protein product [Tilletia controversa]
MLPMFRRIFESILVRRLSPDNDWSQLHPGQAGFRRGWSCASAQMYSHESAHTRRNIAVFLDFANAFPSVTASLVAFVFETRGAPQSTQRLVWSLLTRAASAVLVVNGRRCRELAFQRGLTQGAICSPALFNLIINELVRLLNGRAGPAHLRAIFFADDGSLLASSVAEAQELLNLAKAWADERGFRFSVGKCGVVARRRVTLFLGPEPIPQVDSYKYLGIPRTADGLYCVACLSRVTTSMNNTLRLLCAVGGAWSSMVRLRLYQSVCRSLSDFGAGIAALTLASLAPHETASMQSAFEAAEEHHRAAVKWISAYIAQLQSHALSPSLPTAPVFAPPSASSHAHALRRVLHGSCGARARTAPGCSSLGPRVYGFNAAQLYLLAHGPFGHGHRVPST